MTKNVTVRFEDSVAALVSARAANTGVSFNQAVQDAVIEAELVAKAQVVEIARAHIDKYRTVLDRLA